ncbi:MAG: hypothetical protein ABW164_06400 [Sphingobium sp.]
MTDRLMLRLHVAEPWDFERIAGSADLAGWTLDHDDPDKEEWEVHLDHAIVYHDHRIGRLLAAPRYVGEHLVRMFDAVTGFPVRLAYVQEDGWHYAFAAMMSQRHDDEQESPS